MIIKSLKNFGPIKEAKDIKINDLTVFIGKNNTGKTYLAKLIYFLNNPLYSDEMKSDKYKIFKYLQTNTKKEFNVEFETNKETSKEIRDIKKTNI